MELKTPMVFVKHIIAAQRGNAQSIQYLCERTSGQFVKICRQYDLSNSEIEAVLAKAYGRIFTDIKSVRNPQTFMSWAGKIVEECCVEIAGHEKIASKPASKVPAAAPSAPVAAAEKEVETVPVAVVEAPPAPVAAAEKAVETVPAAVVEAPSAPVAAAEPIEEKPAAFYDENAYVKPSGTYHAEVNYADEAASVAAPTDNRVIPVDELVYHPNAEFISSGEPSAPSDVQPAITQDTSDETRSEGYETYDREVISDESGESEKSSTVPSDEEKAAVPDPSIYASIPTFASSYEEEAVFQDSYPVSEGEPGGADIKQADTVPEGSAFEPTVVPAENESTIPEDTAPAVDAAEVQRESITAAPLKDDADEPDVDLVEREETDRIQDEAEIGVNDPDYDENEEDDDDDEDEEELRSGLAFRTKVLIGLLCVFIFGACVGIGYAISKGMTAHDTSSSEPGVVETQADTIDETEPESLVDSLIESVIESLAESSTAEADNSRETAASTDTNIDDSTDNAGGQTSESQADDPADTHTTESQAADPAAGTVGEVTARADISTYLGGTFASVFRDYPDIPRSVYRGELSLADAHIGFIGSYDATQPVSSTIVESVSLLSEGGNFNINGFYIGMTAADAESLAAACGYTALEMTAESSREYEDADNNVLSLTIDGGVVKSATLRSATADNVTMESADEVIEEIPEEIPGEEGGVG